MVIQLVTEYSCAQYVYNIIFFCPVSVAVTEIPLLILALGKGPVQT